MADDRKESATRSGGPVLVLQPIGAGGEELAADTAYQANVGQVFGLRAVIVIYVNGEPSGAVAPIAVQWTFAGVGSYVNAYRPTVLEGAPDANVNLAANPVFLYYWWQAGNGGAIPINCVATGPDGTQYEVDDTLALTANTYRMSGMDQGPIQIQELQGVPILSFGDSVGQQAPGLALAFETSAGAIYPGWLGAIQIVRSVRQFTGQSGKIYVLANTGDSFVLDAHSTAPDFLYGKKEVEEGEIAEYTFDDTPNVQLLAEIDGDPIVEFSVNETFLLYFVFNGSQSPAPNADNSQIWFPITPPITWGWQATAAPNDQGQWAITSEQVFDVESAALTMPSWAGTINVALRTRPKRLLKTIVIKAKNALPQGA